MENWDMQQFLSRVETVINGVRGELLVLQKDPASVPAFSAHADQIAMIERSPDRFDSAGIENDLALLGSQLRSLSHADDRVPIDAIRSMLDRIADIESKIALSKMGEDWFDEDLDRLLDETWGLQPVSSSLISETPAETASDSSFEADEELLKVFSEEAENLLTGMERNLQLLVSEPGNKEALWEIRRRAHTFKGSAGIVGFQHASRLAHRIEDLLEELKEDDRSTNEAVIPILLTATECLRSLVGGMGSERLDHVLRHVHSEIDRLSSSLIEEAPQAAVDSPNAAETQPTGAVRSSTAIPQAIVRVPLNDLDALVALARELVVNRSVIGQRMLELNDQVDELHNATRRLQSLNSRLEVDLGSVFFETNNLVRSGFQPSAPGAQHYNDSQQDIFHALEMDRYSEIHEAIRDLAETSSDSTEIGRTVSGLKEELDSLFESQRRLFDELQSRILSTRMVAFETLKTRLERAVRVTCEDEKKRAEVHIENGNTQVDTQILDAMAEPLIHLMKNAVVHGLESPETRRLLGKNEIGKITVRAESEETHVILTVTDDGAGVDLAALKERAIGNGFILRETAAALSNDELLSLMFESGLTTARRVDLNAGRGVGMNIIKSSVESHSGTISIITTPHAGTTFTMRVPLKLAVTKALLVSCEGGIYAVPMKHIRRIVEISPEEIAGADGVASFEYAGKEYRYRSINELLGLGESAPNGDSFLTALLVRSASGNAAISVDSVMRTEEIVIKPLPKPFDEIRDVLGAAFVSSGELAPIIDLPYLTGLHPQPAAAPKAVRTREQKTLVMVVDDSPSIRHMTSRVIRDAGWDVVTAKDGVEALEILGRSPRMPDVILTDIEMPRMGGFELASAVTEDPRTSEIPVVVITSRTAEKHRERARERGVAEYLVKPYVESELIEMVQQLTLVRA